jgi:hypothetical protein
VHHTAGASLPPVLRSPAAALTGLVAAVLLPVSLLSVWVHGVVSDTDTYVETVTPLADDDTVKAAVVKELGREAMQLVATTGSALPSGSARLVHLVVQRVVDSPTFRIAWVEANRSAHEQLVAVLEERGSPRLDGEGRLTIELGSVLSAVAQALAAQGLVDAGRAADIDASFPVMDAGQLAKARRAYDALDTLGFWLPVLWAALALLTLLLARRRLAATAKLAVAALLTLGLLALALLFARDAFTEDLPQRDVAVAVWDVVVARLWRELEVCAAVLVVVAAVAGVLSGVLAREGAPSGQDPDGAQAYG